MHTAKRRITPLKIILLILLIFILCCPCYSYILRKIAINMAFSHLESKYQEPMVLLDTSYIVLVEDPPRYLLSFCPESNPEIEFAVRVYQNFVGSPILYLPSETDPVRWCQADTYIIDTFIAQMTPKYQEYFSNLTNAECEIYLSRIHSAEAIGVMTNSPLRRDMTLDELENGVRYGAYIKKESFHASDLSLLWDFCQWCSCNNYAPEIINMQYKQEGPRIHLLDDDVAQANDFDEFVEIVKKKHPLDRDYFENINDSQS